ncbi:outer membrane lipoprotein carrier protein LolA [Phycisphaerales bacterium AB-hyl4]|uniref:Outer membrane lipoprotein carrier protein LolA n=1 Tax=Natronomicrosphaera hydrolytica TaxID=3242702 RepID=A0ABV4U8F0_9BACT
MILTLTATVSLSLLTACTTRADPPPEQTPRVAPDVTPADASNVAPEDAPDVASEEAAEMAHEAEDTAEQWLERIEARSDEIDTLTARVRYDRVQVLLGDEQTRFGRLTYDAGPPARFHVHFDRMAMHDEMQMQERRYIFDGRWLAERHDDQRLFILRELVAEGDEGEDLLRLGEGPFALPLDLQKDTVLERFEVALVTEDEPAFEEAVLLRLTPRPGVEIDQTQIDIWYDRETRLPLQVRTVNDVDQTESTIRLGEMQTGVDVDEAVFDTTPPDAAGWQVERRALD